MDVLTRRQLNQTEDSPSGLLSRLHLDVPLLLALLTLCGFGLVVLYSAGRQNIDLVINQSMRMTLGLLLLLALAWVTPKQLAAISPWLYLVGIILLILVLINGLGIKVNGSQRWLDLKVMRFQPSEILKLASPMMLAWLLSRQPLPPSWLSIIQALIISAIPVLLILDQPDLGTGLMVLFAALCVLFMAGLSWRIIGVSLALITAALPLFWEWVMYPYQRVRVLTLLNPESDPLNAGYHIIQSKIAIGSGGVYGKGWLNGTQANLQFLPEGTTDFIYAVIAEEFGLIGLCLLIALYFFIIVRSFMLITRTQDSYSRLLGGAIVMNFFFCVFVNAGMVSGILPVVGVPLPFISYGGTSLVTILAGFGIIMSIYAHPKR